MYCFSLAFKLCLYVLRFIHVVACICLFLLIAEQYSIVWIDCNLLIHYLDCIQLQLLQTKLLNINIQVFIWTYAFNLDYCLGVMCFNFLRELPNFSRVGVLHFTFPSGVFAGSSSSTSLLTLHMVSLINFPHSNRYMVVFYCDFDCISLQISYIEYLFMCLFAISFFVKCVKIICLFEFSYD